MRMSTGMGTLEIIGLVSIAMAIGMALTVYLVLLIIGKEARDLAFGQKINKPIIVKWANGHDQEIHLMVHDTVVFRGLITGITMSNTMNRASSMTIDIHEYNQARQQYATLN